MPDSSGITTFADLFCGIGGFHYAADSLGLRCVFASDIDDACRMQYERNFNFRPAGDITEINADDVPDHDLLFAGFPCQAFSIIGERKGKQDSHGRGVLFLEILRILEAKGPKAVILENVRQFSTFDQGRTMDQVLRGLGNLGYEIDWKVLNALDFGVPQKRERTIIVGMMNGLEYFIWPKGEKEYRSLSDLLELDPDRQYYASDYIRAKRQERHMASQRPAVWHENKGGNVSSHPYSCALRANPSYNYLLVDGERRLTPRELLRLQGFPESFDVISSYTQIRKQTGNAVPVPMVQAVMRSVLDAATCYTGERIKQDENGDIDNVGKPGRRE